MGLGDWIRRLLGGADPDDDSAAVEEYHRPDPGFEDLQEHEAPSFFGGVEPTKEDFEEPRDPEY